MSSLNTIVDRLKSFFSSIGKQDAAPLFRQPLSDTEIQNSLRGSNPPINVTASPPPRGQAPLQAIPQAQAREVAPPPQATPGADPLSGFSGPAESVSPYKDAIIAAARNENIDPNLLTALLFQESSLQPNVSNAGGDRGIGQISSIAHPEVTDEQAFDPQFAIPFAARLIRRGMDSFGGDINRGVASYNVGQGGARVKGPAPFGGGPRGQAYLDDVARHLTPETKQRLGLITSPSQ